MADSPYINSQGLLNAKLADDLAENAPLWSVEYLFLKHDPELYQSLLDYIDKSYTGTPGLYNQNPIRFNKKEDYMSPDQLIAFIAALKMADKKDEIKAIWSYLWRHFFTYDNLQPGKTNFDRTMQLSAILFSGVMAGHFYLKPILSAALLYSCATKRTETSGKLKAWVMFKSAGMKITEAVCNLLIKTNSYLKSWKGVFFEYFKEAEHPLRKLV
jgi:hypothetical protein